MRVGKDALHGEFAVQTEELQQGARRATATGCTSILFWGWLRYDGEAFVVGRNQGDKIGDGNQAIE